MQPLFPSNRFVSSSAPQSWMVSPSRGAAVSGTQNAFLFPRIPIPPEVKRLLQLMGKNTYIRGGYVRDAVRSIYCHYGDLANSEHYFLPNISLSYHDIDLVTDLSASQIMDLFPEGEFKIAKHRNDIGKIHFLGEVYDVQFEVKNILDLGDPHSEICSNFSNNGGVCNINGEVLDTYQRVTGINGLHVYMKTGEFWFLRRPQVELNVRPINAFHFLRLASRNNSVANWEHLDSVYKLMPLVIGKLKPYLLKEKMVAGITGPYGNQFFYGLWSNHLTKLIYYHLQRDKEFSYFLSEVKRLSLFINMTSYSQVHEFIYGHFSENNKSTVFYLALLFACLFEENPDVTLVENVSEQIPSPMSDYSENSYPSSFEEESNSEKTLFEEGNSVDDFDFCDDISENSLDVSPIFSSEVHHEKESNTPNEELNKLDEELSKLDEELNKPQAHLTESPSLYVRPRKKSKLRFLKESVSTKEFLVHKEVSTIEINTDDPLADKPLSRSQLKKLRQQEEAQKALQKHVEKNNSSISFEENLQLQQSSHKPAISIETQNEFKQIQEKFGAEFAKDVLDKLNYIRKNKDLYGTSDYKYYNKTKSYLLCFENNFKFIGSIEQLYQDKILLNGDITAKNQNETSGNFISFKGRFFLRKKEGNKALLKRIEFLEGHKNVFELLSNPLEKLEKVYYYNSKFQEKKLVELYYPILSLRISSSSSNMTSDDFQYAKENVLKIKNVYKLPKPYNLCIKRNSNEIYSIPLDKKNEAFSSVSSFLVGQNYYDVKKIQFRYNRKNNMIEEGAVTILYPRPFFFGLKAFEQEALFIGYFSHGAPHNGVMIFPSFLCFPSLERRFYCDNYLEVMKKKKPKDSQVESNSLNSKNTLYFIISLFSTVVGVKLFEFLMNALLQFLQNRSKSQLPNEL